MTKSLLAILALQAGITSSAQANTSKPTDPTLEKKINRTITKLPNLTSKSPGYILAVIGKGEKPQQRWVVYDVHEGDTLTGSVYIDLNGNGDLTEANEKFPIPNKNKKKATIGLVDLTNKDGSISGYKMRVTVPNMAHKSLARQSYTMLVVNPKNKGQLCWGDHTSALMPGDSVKTAPVLHFHGPLQMGLETQNTLEKRGPDTYELYTSVGTYGIGKGAFTWLPIFAVPFDIHPEVTLEWQAKEEGKPPVISKHILKSRCWGCRFHGAVSVPAGAKATGNIKLIMSYDTWKDPNDKSKSLVTPKIITLPIPEK